MSKSEAIKQTLEYVDGADGDESAQWARRAVELLEIGRALKDQIGTKSDEAKGKDGTGLLGRLSQIEDELRFIIVDHGLEGVRYNNVVFTCTAQPGRTTIDFETFKKELLMADVDVAVIRKAEAAAQKVGNASWKREWRDLEAKR